MDSVYEIDLDALLRTVRRSDHVIVRFSTLSQRLFIDFRTREGEGPGVFVLPTATTIQERLASIAAARPHFPRPERLYVMAWPLRVGGLVRLGFLAAARQRLAAMDAFDQLRDLEQAFHDLQRAEQDETRRAITGDGYRTIWPAAPGSPAASDASGS
ncbi:MAG: hypothetical protein EXR68_07155 [Dehalococcoidia bacterium]|nr:hypothetical protein [Dehalococcoidia bacterium]